MTAKKSPVASILALSFIAALLLSCCGKAHEDYNAYDPKIFPARASDRIFEVPLDPSSLLVVIPASLEPRRAEFERLFDQKSGNHFPFRSAAELTADELRGKNLVLIGNIMNNPLVLEMYMKRRAFTDAYFPGEGGVFIHPAKSIWDPARNVLIIGVSRDEDLESGFAGFLDLLKPGSKSIGVLRLLKTEHKIPDPPESAESTFGAVKKNVRERPPYRAAAQWALMYFFTGDPKWARLFLDGMTVLRERAEKTGKWITEPWSNVYFALWNIFGAWRLIDDDPVFTAEDRRLVEDVLWGYTRYIKARPYLDEDKMPLHEPRQNHYTFLALSLDAAYRYYTEKYGLTGLDSMADKVHRCFDLGQASSYRPNDDGGAGYQVLTPSHYLYYALQNNDLSFLEKGKLRTLVDLVIATIDSRGDPVTFGDIGAYSPRKPEDPQKPELQFLSMAAWYYKDGACQWLYDWLGKRSQINLDPWSPLGLGLYATEIKPEPPTRWTGILPVLLDEASLRWSARRSEKASQLPLAGRRYFDKLAFRRGFDPQDEYMLLDGTSTFAHGHEDGNTITRLTWKDRIWLFDLHYIKAGPQEHNGVSVVRNGTQEAPPPLNELAWATEFDTAGMTLTTARDYNGADWQRHIFWKKGRYFLFLDRITAREAGQYRLENRWRTRGEVKLEGNSLAVRQGEMSFFIKSADSAERALQTVPDEYNGDWNYPYGPDATIVCLARKKLTLPADSSWIFANLMYAADTATDGEKELFKAGEHLYVVSDAGEREYVGLDPAILEKAGISTDCALFVQTSDRLFLFGPSRVSWERGEVRAPEKFSLEIDWRMGAAVLVVQEEGDFTFTGVEVIGRADAPRRDQASLRLKPGKYELMLAQGMYSFRLLDSVSAGKAIVVMPEAESVKPIDFGLEPENKIESKTAVSAVSADGEGIVCGTNNGSVFRVDGGKKTALFELPEGREVLAIRAADVNRDGRKEIITSDSGENLFCHDSAGALLWKLKVERYFGRDANVVDIWVDDIDGNGSPTILAATNGWKLYAVRPDGIVRWENFIFYHQLTKVRVLKNKDKPLIAVGTVYQTPFNLVDPANGAVIWKTWEQTGSETMSTTDYCGKHLRDMVFVDVDGDGNKDIVFGNEYQSVYALDASDGHTIWKAQVGDKVSVMKLLEAGEAGEERILVATDAGEIYILDRRGRRLRMTVLGAGITGMEIVPHEPQGRREIVVSTDDGRVAVCDDKLMVRASLATGAGRLMGIYPALRSGSQLKFYAVAANRIFEIAYQPLSLRPSRHY
jgi:outer membrane protein assembly factor BamB